MHGVDSFLRRSDRLSGFEQVLLIGSLLSPLFSRLSYESQRRDTLYMLNTLPTLSSSNAPIFVFAHITCPHPPFLFDAQGHPIQSDRPYTIMDGPEYFKKGGNRQEYLTGYVEQLRFLNGRMEKVIDALLSDTKRERVIILQGDHGPGLELNWASPEESNLFERFSILNAYRVPPKLARQIPDDATPVNSFRRILGHYFGTDTPPLRDRSFFSSLDRPYDFIEVTDRLDVERNASGRRHAYEAMHQKRGL